MSLLISASGRLVTSTFTDRAAFVGPGSRRASRMASGESHCRIT